MLCIPLPQELSAGAPVPRVGGDRLLPGGLGGTQLLLPGFLHAWEPRVLKLGTYRLGNCFQGQWQVTPSEVAWKWPGPAERESPLCLGSAGGSFPSAT